MLKLMKFGSSLSLLKTLSTKSCSQISRLQADDVFGTHNQFAGMSGYLGADHPLNHPSGFDGGSYYLHLTPEF